MGGSVLICVQISSDALHSYVDAVERPFGADVDYGQIVKFYDAEPIGPGRYAPPRVTGSVIRSVKRMEFPSTKQ
jgi:hypothetical protein